MKVSRNQLKGIVKECLMEILAEGLLHESAVVPKKAKLKSRKSTQKIVENVEPKEDKFIAAVNDTVAGLTNDPIMTNIFRDTAMTTLQDQLGSETSPQAASGNSLMNEQAQGAELEDLFGEASDRWASLAFTEKKVMP